MHHNHWPGISPWCFQSVIAKESLLKSRYITPVPWNTNPITTDNEIRVPTKSHQTKQPATPLVGNKGTNHRRGEETEIKKIKNWSTTKTTSHANSDPNTKQNYQKTTIRGSPRWSDPTVGVVLLVALSLFSLLSFF